MLTDTLQAVRTRVSGHPVALTATLLGLLATVVTGAGSWVPSFWGDEAASVMSAERSLPSLLSALANIDAVHGVYYAFLHFWIPLFGTSELATRAPSAIGVGLMVGGVVVLASRFVDVRFAALAGVVAIILPRSTYLGTEARSYALGAAASVWLTVLLIHLVRRRANSSPGWILYGVAAAACVYLFLYLGLLLVIHAVYLAVMHRASLGGWARGALVAVLLVAPFVWIAYGQRGQIAFLSKRDYATPYNVLISQWFGTPVVAVICWVLILVAAITWGARAFRLRRVPSGIAELVLLGLLWVVLPTSVILVANAFLIPIYNIRYLSFSTPGAALVVAVGIAVVARRAPRARTAISVVIVAALIVASFPGYLDQRMPWAKGSDWRDVSAALASRAQPGDPVIFDQQTQSSKDPRRALRMYPAAFAGLRDVELVTPFFDTPGLWDRVAPLPHVFGALAGSQTIWALELSTGRGTPEDITYLQANGYRVVDSVKFNSTVLYQLDKE